MGVAGDEAHAGQAAGDERTQEPGPDRAGLARADLAAQDLPLAPLVDSDPDQDRHLQDPATLADLLDLGVEPDVRVAVLVEPALPERADRPVELAAQPAHLALADPVDAQGPDQGIDLAGGHPEHVRLGDDGVQRALRAPTWLEQPVREVAAPADPGDLELDRARPGVPVPAPVAVAVPGPLSRPLVGIGAELGCHLELHQGFRHRLHGLAQEVRVPVVGGLPDLLEQCHPVRGHRDRPPS
jgi:hypothetical protein